MKKIISIAMVALCLSLIVVLFTACGDNKDNDTTTTTPTTEGVSIEDATVDMGALADKTTTADKSDKTDTTKAPAKPSGSGNSSSSSSQSTKPPKTTASATTKPNASNNSGEGVQLAPGSIYDDWY